MKRMSVAVACMAFFVIAASGLAGPADTSSTDPNAVSKPILTAAPAAGVPRLPPVPAAEAPSGVPFPSALEPPPPSWPSPYQAQPDPYAKTVPSPAEWKQAVLSFQVYRVRGDIAGETSLTDNLWEGIKGEDLEAIKGPFLFFTLANLTVAGVKFRATETRWTWDGRDQPPSGKRVETVAAPKVVTLMGESFTIAMESQQPVEYFEKRSDGLFELKTIDAQTGLRFEGSVEARESGRLIVRNLTITLRSIESRIPIEGVGLDVGAPTIKTREYKTSIAVKPGRYYGIQVATEGYGFMILRLRVDPATAGGRPRMPSPDAAGWPRQPRPSRLPGP